MRDSLTPTEGARFLFEREHEDEGGAAATYRAAIYTPSVTYHGSAILRDDGTFTVTLSEADVPADLVASLEMLAKLTGRSAGKKREDGLAPWPARVLRWRGPGRGE